MVIFEEDLLTLSILNCYDVPKDISKNKDLYGYQMSFNKKKNYLALSYPSSQFVLWDVANKSENKIKKNY